MAIFTSSIIGPPPGTSTVGTNLWIDLGLIPTGYDMWIGSVVYTSPGKTITFELRTNLTGQGAGTTAATKILDTVDVSAKSKTITRDLYKSGTLHTATVKGTGVEHWWLHLVSKTSTATSYLYSAYYTTE